jgi:PelA/Pel-15E family pectate lyase
VKGLVSVCCGALAVAPLAVAVGWREVLRQPAEWYATVEARAVAEAVMLYQSPEGGWTKNTDMTEPPTADYLALKPSARAPTIDNDATTTQLELLARVISAGGAEPAFNEAFLRGFDYLLASQYPNGGWPQYFPLRKGYYSHITYNDDAMVNVLELLRDASEGRVPYAFVDSGRRARGGAAVARGIECLLATQIRKDRKLLAWCAQHDAQTLEPAWARNFEPPSLSGNESVGVVRFLMSIEDPDARVIAAIEGAVGWLRGAVVQGLRVERFTGADGRRDVRTVTDPEAPPIWARFYDLETVAPVFTGRDRVPPERLDEIEYERRNGYAYLGNWPAKLLEKEYPKWRERVGREAR